MHPPRTRSIPTQADTKSIDETLGNEARVCNQTGSGCNPVKLLPSFTTAVNPIIKRDWPVRTKEEKALALEALLSWRKSAFERWQATLKWPNGAETGILPGKTAEMLSKQFSKIRTENDVAMFASNSGWSPRGDYKKWLFEIAQVLSQLNKDLDDGLLASSLTPTAVLAPDLVNNGPSDDDHGDGCEEEVDS
ncbi:hypothetical protein EC968_005925 [Mortierella alpina]|nr:hypothetical protein EC968_005925 [Mortierella alpina]